MVFMVTMTRTAENCPGNNRQKIPEGIAADMLKEEVSWGEAISVEYQEEEREEKKSKKEDNKWLQY